MKDKIVIEYECMDRNHLENCILMYSGFVGTM